MTALQWIVERNDLPYRVFYDGAAVQISGPLPIPLAPSASKAPCVYYAIVVDEDRAREVVAAWARGNPVGIAGEAGVE